MTNIQEEIWISIPNYEGLYEVSNLGRVRSLDRICRGIRIKGIIRKLSKDSHGYMFLPLSKNNIQSHFLVYHLVYFSFTGEVKKKGWDVDHINQNKDDNRLINLQYIPKRDNIIKQYISNKSSKSSKYIGVCWLSKRSRWQASVYINGKSIYLGLHKTERDASDIYNQVLSEIITGKTYKSIQDILISNSQKQISTVVKQYLKEYFNVDSDVYQTNDFVGLHRESRSCLYILFDNSDPVYIGKSSCIGVRVMNHKYNSRKGNYVKVFNSIIVAPVKDDKEATYLERWVLRHNKVKYSIK